MPKKIRKVKPGLNLRIKIGERVFVHYPAKTVQDAKDVRHCLSPPDGPVPYSEFRLFRDGKEIQF